MRQSLSVEQLETRELLSGGLGLVQSAIPDSLANWQQAESRSLFPNGSEISGTAQLATTVLADILGANGSALGRWDQMLVGTWYVPAPNLLAYLVGSTGTNPVPIADQTIFDINAAYDGFVSGVNYVQLSLPTALGWVQEEPLLFTMSGFVTPQGQIRITFTPSNPDQPTVTGVGNMELVDGSWRMTMQMATGSAPYVIHWAYMTRLTPGVIPPAATGPSSGSLPSFEEGSWLQGTDWALADSGLFGSPGGGVFRIDGYDGGYFWGEGVGPTPFSVVGSVTPEGNLFLVLSPVGGSAVTRTGSLTQGADGRWEMLFRSYEGSPAVGTAWPLDLRTILKP